MFKKSRERELSEWCTLDSGTLYGEDIVNINGWLDPSDPNPLLSTNFYVSEEDPNIVSGKNRALRHQVDSFLLRCHSHTLIRDGCTSAMTEASPLRQLYSILPPLLHQAYRGTQWTMTGSWDWIALTRRWALIHRTPLLPDCSAIPCYVIYVVAIQHSYPPPHPPWGPLYM